MEENKINEGKAQKLEHSVCVGGGETRQKTEKYRERVRGIGREREGQRDVQGETQSERE